MCNLPTNLFTILEPRDQEIGKFYVVQERRETDFEAPKLWKGSSGWPPLQFMFNTYTYYNPIKLYNVLINERRMIINN